MAKKHITEKANVIAVEEKPCNFFETAETLRFKAFIQLKIVEVVPGVVPVCDDKLHPGATKQLLQVAIYMQFL